MYENTKKNGQFKCLKISKVESIEVIRKIIFDFNKVFKPSLSERIIDLNDYAEKLYSNAIILVVTEEDDIIGFVAFYANDKNDNVAYLTQIGVKNKSQNKNIGQSLLELCIKISRNNGMKNIKLEVHNDNIKAIHFYKKNGFKFYGKASANSMYMAKKLK